jgi:hypothetical protein
MPIKREKPIRECFNSNATLPFELRIEDFSIAMQDVYDLFFDVNSLMLEKGLQRLEEMLRPAIMSGLLSDFFISQFGKTLSFVDSESTFQWASRSFSERRSPNDSAKAGSEGDKDDPEGWRGRRHAWSEKSMDGCLRLSDRLRNTTNSTSCSDALYRNLYRSGVRGGLSQERARRTRHADSYTSPRGHPETTRGMDLPGVKTLTRQASKFPCMQR